MTRPLVLIHGFTGAPESWAEVLDHLRDDDARAASPSSTAHFAPAALGHDGTSGPAGIDSFADEVDRLAGEVRGRDLAGSHVVGYSMGGRLALGLLVRHPRVFAAATLIGTSPGLADPVEREARAERDEGWARLLETDGVPTFVAAWEALPLFGSQAALPADAAERQRRIRLSHDPRGLARSLRMIGLAAMPDYRPSLGGIEVPVRLVAGERDAKFRALASEMAERLPRASLVTVEGAGHNIVLERPDRVARLLSEEMES